MRPELWLQYTACVDVSSCFPDLLPPVAERVVCDSDRSFQRNGVSSGAAVLTAAHLLRLLSDGVTAHPVHLHRSHTHLLLHTLTGYLTVAEAQGCDTCTSAGQKGLMCL